MTQSISQSPAWTALKKHQQKLANDHLWNLFSQDNQRIEHFSCESCGLLLDYSKNRLTAKTLKLLQNLAETANLKTWIDKMFSGELINTTEKRAALHIALRNRSNQAIFVNGKNVMPAVNTVLAKMGKFSESVRSGQWRGYTNKPIESIVNIGIGGSDLGPAMVTHALKIHHHSRLRSYFVSNVDSTHLFEILAEINPETALFIISSKSFSTQETMLNAHSARRWLIQQLGSEEAVSKHFVAVSSHRERVTKFGMDIENMFELWDWVGGRFSVWSAIGLPIVIMIGMDKFEELLSGAHAMDTHFQTTPVEHNMPILLGLIGVWYSSFFGAATQAILPYDFALKYFPAYLQQLSMESLGKQVTRTGESVDYLTCPVIWGTLGNNGQHAFYQLLHQGTQLISSDLIVALKSQHNVPEHQAAVLSNALAQAQALMKGRTLQETQAANLPQAEHRVFKGNQPTNMIFYQKLTPSILGALVALYEHKVFVQSVCWNINAFDQWGVELGKEMASDLLDSLDNIQNFDTIKALNRRISKI